MEFMKMSIFSYNKNYQRKNKTSNNYNNVNIVILVGKKKNLTNIKINVEAGQYGV